MSPLYLLIAGALVLQAGERAPLPVAFTSPTGASGRLGLSEVIRGLDQTFEAGTNLEVEPMDPAVVDQCDRSLTCVVRKARPDYVRERLRRADGTYAPYRAHTMKLRSAGREVPRLLLVVGVVTGAGRGDRILLQMVSTDLVLETFHESDRGPGWRERVEAEVFERAVLASLRSEALATPASLRAFLEEAMDGELRRTLRRYGHDEAFGAIELRPSVAGASVRLDGRLLGRAEVETRIEDVRAGRRSLLVEAYRHRPFQADIRVTPGETARLRAELIRAETPASKTLRRTTLWTGVAALAASAAVFGWAASRSSATTVCFEGPDCQTGERLVGQPPLAAVGAGLAGAGAGWSLGALTLDRRRPVPWPSWLLGTALGVGAYGVVAATAD